MRSAGRVAPRAAGRLDVVEPDGAELRLVLVQIGSIVAAIQMMLTDTAGTVPCRPQPSDVGAGINGVSASFCHMLEL